MRREDIYKAIGDLDEGLLHKSEQGWSHSGMFRRFLTTAACLILAVGIGTLFFLPRGGSSADPGAPETGLSSFGTMDQSSHAEDPHADCRAEHTPCSDRILIGDIYFQSDYGLCAILDSGKATYADGTVWCYDPSVGKTQVLADMAVRFSETQTGYYCTDVNTGDVYRIEGTSLIKTAALPEYQNKEMSTDMCLVDLVGDDLYYRESRQDGVVFCVMNVQDGTVRQLTEPDDAVGADVFRMWDGRIYYIKNIEEDLMVHAQLRLWAVDVFTSENVEVTPENWPEDMHYMYRMSSQKNNWLFAVSHGELMSDSIYRLDLSDRSFTELVQTNDNLNILSLHMENEIVYWAVYDSGPEAADTGFRVMEYDLVTETAVERDEVISVSSGTLPMNLCIFPWSGGCYYDESWESFADTYYYDYETGVSICIAPKSTVTDPAPMDAYIPGASEGGETCWAESSLLTEGENLYFSTWLYFPNRGETVAPGLWYYERETGNAVLLGSFAASFTQTPNGNFCTDGADNIYRLKNGTLERIGTLPAVTVEDVSGNYAGLLDVAEDTVYYTYNDMGENGRQFVISAADSQGGTRELFRGEPGYELQNGIYRNGTVYYYTLYQTADPAFWALDVSTGENTRLEFDFPYDRYGGLYRADICEFYEDCILVEAEFYNDNTRGFFRLNYDDLSAVSLYFVGYPGYDPICRDGNTFYYASTQWKDEERTREVLASELYHDSDLVQHKIYPIPSEAGSVRPCPRGCYYKKSPASPKESEGLDIYYYDYETQESTCINDQMLGMYEPYLED